MANTFPKTLILPSSGKTVTLQRKFKGKDQVMAERLTPDRKPGHNTKLMYALLTQVVLLEGQPVLLEDFYDWDLEDINAVVGIMFPRLANAEDEDLPNESPTPQGSPPLSNGASGQPN